MKKIRILIVDDHALMRMGLATALNLEPDLTVIAEASTGRQALELYTHHTPDLVLMDLRLPDMSGDQVTATLCANDPNARILAFTSYNTQEDIFRCIHAGARSFLPKESLLNELLAAIRTVHAGQNYLPPAVASRLMDRMHSPELSPREQAVLELLVKGRTNKEIAQALFIAETTVKDHVSSIFTKLHATDRTQASTLAIQRGLVRLE
ncbi:MAG: response regulator transcription factor [Verrucomicrobiota bacterium]